MSELSTCIATLEDAEVIAAIYNESILAYDSTMIDEPIDADEIRRHIKKLTDREMYILLKRADYVIGWGVIKQFGEGPAYRFTGETSVFLRRNEVRKGYGTYLKKLLIDRCRDFGYHHLVARVWATNQASIIYNENFGYEVVGIQREIGYMQEEWKDVALMQLLL